MSNAPDSYVYRLIEQRSSFSGDAMLATDYANDGIAKGQAFEISYTINIPAGQTRFVWINYAAYTDLSPLEPYFGQRLGTVVVLPPTYTCSAGPVQVNVRRDPTVTPDTGALIRTVRKNTTVANFPQVEWRFQPTVTDQGADPFNYLAMPGFDTQGTGLPFYRGNTSSTLVEVVNNSGEATVFYYGQVWYEI